MRLRVMQTNLFHLNRFMAYTVEISYSIKLIDLMRVKGVVSFFLLPIVLSLSTCDVRPNHSAQGYVESENLYLTSPYSGTLRSLPVLRGALVTKGDLIFQLDADPEALKITEIDKVLIQEKALLVDLKAPRRKPEIGVAKAQIEQVNARLSLAKLRMKRFRALYEKKAGNLDESDAAVQRFRELQALKKQREYEIELSMLGARTGKVFAQAAKLKSVQARKELFEWQVEQKSRYAPDGGTIADTYFVEGEWVPAGNPVAALQMSKHVWVVFFVPAAFLPKIHTNQIVNLTCAGCPPSKAVIAYIAPEAEYMPPLVYSRDNDDKLVFRIHAKPIKPGLFKPGQPVTVSGF